MKVLATALVLLASIYPTTAATAQSLPFDFIQETHGRWALNIHDYPDQDDWIFLNFLEENLDGASARVKPDPATIEHWGFMEIYVGCDAREDDILATITIAPTDKFDDLFIGDNQEFDVLYRFDDGPLQLRNWGAEVPEAVQFPATATQDKPSVPREHPKFVGRLLVGDDDDAKSIFSTLAEASLFYLQILLPDGLLVTRQLDITGGREVVARMKEVCDPGLGSLFRDPKPRGPHSLSAASRPCVSWRTLGRRRAVMSRV